MFTAKRARTFIIVGIGLIAVGIALAMLLPPTTVFEIVSFALIIGGGLMLMAGIVWYIMNPVRRNIR